ncbi:MAG: polymorphic toxin type 23 domain-containing protein [Bacteroidia bacterium]|nr:polymorphic toxin type 23 domain-containing protein [Bacteroidia bacterium]
MKKIQQLKVAYFSLILILLTLIPVSKSFGQFELNPSFIGTGGVSIRLGKYVNQVGLIGQLAYLEEFVQINAQLRLTYNFTQLGPRPKLPGWEVQSSLGAVVAYGPDYPAQMFLSPISSQLGRRYATGYAWTYYWDQMKTSQWTATIGQHISDISLISENDAYTGFIDDKFRTGTFAVLYRVDNYELAWNTILWTGDTRSKGVKRVKETEYPAKYGYKDLSNGLYGAFSHGITALQAKALLPFNQAVQAQLGLDSERIRHMLQNQLIHDMVFLPENWVKAKNPHVPMLDNDGQPFLFKDGQAIKAAALYFNLALNPTLFY